jgi:hypothetical protein
VAAGIATALALVQTLRLHRATRKPPLPPGQELPSQPPPHPPLGAKDSAIKQRRDKKTAWLRSPWIFLIASWAFVVLAGMALLALNLTAAGWAGLGALAASALIIRGPKYRYATWLRGPGSALFLIILLMLGYVTLFVLFSTSPVTILGATIFGVLGLGIALSVAVTWFPAWPFAESLIVG